MTSLKEWSKHGLALSMSKKKPTLRIDDLEITDQYYIRTEPTPQVLNINDSNGMEMLTITSEGRVIWHQADKADEAADLLISSIVKQIEYHAGIRQTREEWEARITEALVSAAEKEPLTPEALTEVIGKCIMLDKLSGIK